MSIDLNKKQIFSTISEMVVYRPNDANDLFELIKSRGMDNDFSDILSIINFVNRNFDKHPSHEYYRELRDCIQDISNDEIRIIFSHALSNIPT